MYVDLNKELTDEQKAIKQRAHEFAAQVLRPASIELDRLTPEEVIAKGSKLWDVFRTAYSECWHLRGFPEELGGAHLDTLSSHIVNEEWGWGSSDFAIALSVTSFPFAFAAGQRNPQIIEGSRDALRRGSRGQVHRLLGDYGARPRLRHVDARHVDVEQPGHQVRPHGHARRR